MESKLFSTISLRGIELPNRIVVSPMCQYSAVDGSATDWHLLHLGNLSISGAGLVMIEATAVNPVGRITKGDLGLYSDENEERLKGVISACKKFSGNTAIGIQLAHAGRKGSAHFPWNGGGPLSENDAWQILSASAISRDVNWPVPKEMTIYDIESLKNDYRNAAMRANRSGVDLIEMHAAHGYLLHQFLSPISNHRKDKYGGSIENRMRLLLEIAEILRITWPKNKPIGARITGHDWMPGGLTTDEAVIFVSKLKSIGFDYVCVTSAGIVPKTELRLSPGYQVPFASKIKKETGMVTQAVGLITKPEQAEKIIREGDADMIAMGRAFVYDPRWVQKAASYFDVKIKYPPQYERILSDYFEKMS